MRCQRKIVKIVWSQHISNDNIRSRTKQPQLTLVIRKRCLKWFGHVQRMNASRIPRRLYSWNPTHGRRRRGRPRTAWKDTISKDINKEEEGEVAAKDRSVWKFLVHQAAGASMHEADR